LLTGECGKIANSKHVIEDKKATIAWILYDFANSAYTTLIVTFIYATYFTQSIAENSIVGTALWSRGVTITALCVAVLSPILGSMADQSNKRKKFLFIFTALAIIGSAMLYTVTPGQTVLALLWFVLSNIAFEMGSVFYNAYLPEIAPGDKIGRVSGYGWAMGYVGGLLAMFIAMIGFVNPEQPWFNLATENGQNIRATNLLVAVWFAVFSIPFFIFVKDKSREAKKNTIISIKGSLHELQNTFRKIKDYRQIVRFLVARLLYNDALITIFAFGGIYAAGTFGFSFREIMIFGIVLNITAGLGAYLLGFLDDRIGGKNTIMVTLFALVLAAILAVFAPNKIIFWIAGILVGIFSGPNQSASRSLMGRFIPPEHESEFFGFFAFSGKFTAFLGPFFLGLLTDLFDSQRAGISIVILFFAIGAGILSKVNEEEGISARFKQES